MRLVLRQSPLNLSQEENHHLVVEGGRRVLPLVDDVLLRGGGEGEGERGRGGEGERRTEG